MLMPDYRKQVRYRLFFRAAYADARPAKVSLQVSRPARIYSSAEDVQIDSSVSADGFISHLRNSLVLRWLFSTSSSHSIDHATPRFFFRLLRCPRRRDANGTAKRAQSYDSAIIHTLDAADVEILRSASGHS